MLKIFEITKMIKEVMIKPFLHDDLVKVYENKNNLKKERYMLDDVFKALEYD